MYLTDWIQTIAIVLSLIISVIAILQTNKSIRMTEKYNHDANRPYITIYIEFIAATYFEKYIVVKNFGNSAAKILEITVDGIPEGNLIDVSLSSLNGSQIAPNQKFTSYINNEFKRTLYYQVKYQAIDGEIFIEKYVVKTDLSDKLFYTKPSGNKANDTPAVIQRSTNELLKAIK